MPKSKRTIFLTRRQALAGTAALVVAPTVFAGRARADGTLTVTCWGGDYRGWDRRYRGYDSGSFTCKVRYGRVVDIDYKNIRGL